MLILFPHLLLISLAMLCHRQVLQIPLVNYHLFELEYLQCWYENSESAACNWELLLMDLRLNSLIGLCSSYLEGDIIGLYTCLVACQLLWHHSRQSLIALLEGLEELDRWNSISMITASQGLAVNLNHS